MDNPQVKTIREGLEHHLRITTPTQILPASAGGTTQIGNFVAGATAETQTAEIARRKRWERAPKTTRRNRHAAAWKQPRHTPAPTSLPSESPPFARTW